MERARRQKPTGKANVSAAIEQLNAARQGEQKRALNYDVREEGAVYDVVDEDEYAALVNKRREEGAGFIVDDDGGYMDIGQDDHFNREDSEGEDSPEGGRKRKDGKSKGASMW